jgi:VanZ family protein
LKGELLDDQTNLRINPWVVCGRIFFTFCLILTILFIFSNSRQIAGVSEGRSQAVLETAQQVLTKLGQPGLAARLTDHIIRKLGHFSEYMLEGFWLMLCLRVYTKHYFRHISWPMLGALLTAMCDETIQIFTQGRSSQVTDVWIDFSGAMAGLLAALVILWFCSLIYAAFFARNKE